ncbi:hypothetical protein [Labrys monachus]|uniref:Strictosidine synthase n=1 Tax=Labrys monachus TaxID=217067 RepID=A0ABU0FMK9_9HYPH|nr:hypothetical protein [Labrys monachus]MDQ0395716.1 hypothetical protein [Labrys monachus]
MILDPLLDLFRGRTITVPPMDGAFRPDTRLDEAPVLAELPEPDNLAVLKDGLVASSGNAVFSIGEGGEPRVLETYPAPVTALAVSPADEIAVGLETGMLTIGSAAVGLPDAVRCITALAYGADGTLWLANGSSACSPGAWAADLLRKAASGSLWKREAGESSFRQVAGGLAFPNGLLADGDGIVASEAWRHRLIRVGGAGVRAATAADHLPGYPARLSRGADGGVWLCLFAPRNRLVEFVLREERYRQDMLRDVPPAYWIAPAFSSGRDFLEPLQCGGIKTMGVHKPWSPSRSYGMVVRLDAGLMPVSSLHSRADGRRHGTCSAVEHRGRLVVASRGGGCLVTVDNAAAGGS